MTITRKDPVDVLIVAVPETAGSALYGMLDVLLAAGNIWQTLVRSGSEQTLFQVRIVSPTAESFACGNGIPVVPDCSVAENPGASILILPELWLGPDEDIHGRYPELMDWIRRRYKEGSTLYSACSGSPAQACTPQQWQLSLVDWSSGISRSRAIVTPGIHRKCAAASAKCQRLRPTWD